MADSHSFEIQALRLACIEGDTYWDACFRILDINGSAWKAIQSRFLGDSGLLTTMAEIQPRGRLELQSPFDDDITCTAIDVLSDVMSLTRVPVHRLGEVVKCLDWLDVPRSLWTPCVWLLRDPQQPPLDVRAVASIADHILTECWGRCSTRGLVPDDPDTTFQSPEPWRFPLSVPELVLDNDADGPQDVCAALDRAYEALEPFPDATHMAQLAILHSLGPRWLGPLVRRIRAVPLVEAFRWAIDARRAEFLVWFAPPAVVVAHAVRSGFLTEAAYDRIVTKHAGLYSVEDFAALQALTPLAREKHPQVCALALWPGRAWSATERHTPGGRWCTAHRTGIFDDWNRAGEYGCVHTWTDEAGNITKVSFCMDVSHGLMFDVSVVCSDGTWIEGTRLERARCWTVEVPPCDHVTLFMTCMESVVQGGYESPTRRLSWF